jgi:hypothetical protein
VRLADPGREHLLALRWAGREARSGHWARQDCAGFTVKGTGTFFGSATTDRA